MCILSTSCPNTLYICFIYIWNMCYIQLIYLKYMFANLLHMLHTCENVQKTISCISHNMKTSLKLSWMSDLIDFLLFNVVFMMFSVCFILYMGYRLFRRPPILFVLLLQSCVLSDFVCVILCLCVGVFVCLCVCVFVFVGIMVLCLWVCVFVCVCMFVCVCVCLLWVCVTVRLCVCVFVAVALAVVVAVACGLWLVACGCGLVCGCGL